jgi:hypothetical protein
MPGSMPEGKDFIKDFLSKQDIHSILDVGPGSGNYYDLLAPVFPDAEWSAVEIFKPYTDMFHLKDKYDLIFSCDIYDFAWEYFTGYDVVILGDVIEHMEESRGREVIKDATENATWVVLSLPIIDYPQGPSYGNVHETHVEQYSPERIRALLKDYSLVAYQEGEVIGVYIFTK